jgi:two-component system nitrate/nitrite response regulator NarL
VAAPTLIIVHPQPLVRSELTARAERHGAARIVGSAGNAHHAIRSARRHTPDVLIIAAALPGISGPTVVRALRHDTPALRAILLHQQPTPRELAAAARAGIAACIPPLPGDTLPAAIQAVIAGRWPILESLSTAPRALWQLCLAARDAPDPLAPRERSILRGIAAGQSDRQIAAAMALSLAAVKGHTSTLRRRLHAPSRRRAIAHAMAWGLLGAEAAERHQTGG